MELRRTSARIRRRSRESHGRDIPGTRATWAHPDGACSRVGQVSKSEVPRSTSSRMGHIRVWELDQVGVSNEHLSASTVIDLPHAAEQRAKGRHTEVWIELVLARVVSGHPDAAGSKEGADLRIVHQEALKPLFLNHPLVDAVLQRHLLDEVTEVLRTRGALHEAVLDPPLLRRPVNLADDRE